MSLIQTEAHLHMSAAQRPSEYSAANDCTAVCGGVPACVRLHVRVNPQVIQALLFYTFQS